MPSQPLCPPKEASAPVVCVFCASQPGRNPVHLDSARSLAQSLHASNYSLVYGGGTVGIMGELAKSLVALSGPTAVQGVIPRALISTEKGYEGTPVGEHARSPALRPEQHHGAEEAGGKPAERTMSKDEIQKLDSHTAEASVISASEFGATTVVPDMHTRKRLMANKVISGGPGSGFVALAGGYGTIEEVMEMVTWNQLGIHSMPIVLVNIDGYWDGLLQWVRRTVEEGYVSEGNAGILVEVKSTDEVVDALKAYMVSDSRYQLDWTM